jgi:hypothetical protein
MEFILKPTIDHSLDQSPSFVQAQSPHLHQRVAAFMFSSLKVSINDLQ